MKRGQRDSFRKHCYKRVYALNSLGPQQTLELLFAGVTLLFPRKDLMGQPCPLSTDISFPNPNLLSEPCNYGGTQPCSKVPCKPADLVIK